MNLEAISSLIVSILTLIGLILMTIFFVIPYKKSNREQNQDKIDKVHNELNDCKFKRGDVTNEKFNKLIAEFEVQKNESENILENLDEFKSETHDNFKIIFNSIGGLEQSNAKIIEKLDNLVKCVDGLDRNGK